MSDLSSVPPSSGLSSVDRLDEIEQRSADGSANWDDPIRDARWLLSELRDALTGKSFTLCETCASNLEAPMCEDCYRRSGPLAAANSARDAAIAQLAAANREIAALVKHVNDLCDVRDAALKVQAELRDARAEVEMKSERADLFRDAYRDLRSGVRMSLGLPDVLASIGEQDVQLREIETTAQRVVAERDHALAQLAAVRDWAMKNEIAAPPLDWAALGAALTEGGGQE